jgi:hypothetical protein
MTVSAQRGEETIAPVREMADVCLRALRNGRRGRAERLIERLRPDRALRQVTAGHVFASAGPEGSVSAVLSMVNPSEPPPRSFATCLLEARGHGTRLRIDRDVLDADPSDDWSEDAETAGDAIARNVRLLKHAAWHSTDRSDPDEPTEIVSDQTNELALGVGLLNDVLAASGLTQEGRTLRLVLPTGTMPLIVEPMGFEHRGLATMMDAVRGFMRPSLQIWPAARGGTIRVSRVHARASAEGASPMESMRAADRLLSILGPDRMSAAVLI